ncbi:MAG: M14 family metallocarboxypeptidase [Verrucomicrobiota bacterium]|nr:M14 family metallocarboxypeptidase [Verrucomicrobiota bacterium]
MKDRLKIAAHRCHHYPSLVRRWRAIARATGMSMKPFARAGAYRVYCLHTKKMPATGGIYISAGIHGDEPAGTEALVEWAEANISLLSRLHCILFPCLNPWGLVNNNRFDEQHRDLNRAFQNNSVPMIQSLKALIKPFQFALCLTLHEDYDGQGLYIYEVKRWKPFWGEDLLEAARPFIPIEGRTSIDGRRSRDGLVRRTINLKKFAKGLPEAVLLHLHHSERTFTIETPSEFALDERIRAHIAVISESIRRVLERQRADAAQAT